MEGGNEWFVVSEAEERTTFEERLEVENSRVGCLEFTVKGGITLLSRRELGREEGEGLPVGINLLLENTADVRIGGISGEGKWSSGVRMGKKSSVRQGLFGLLKGMCHRSCPGKSFGRANESISERKEIGSGVGNKTAVEVDKAEETLELFDGGGLRIVCDGLYSAHERRGV